MKRFFRKVYRIVRLIFWTAWCVSVMKCCCIGKKHDDRIRLAAKHVQHWAEGILHILNYKLNVKGDFPENAGLLIVSNHLGYIDIVVHAAIGGVRFAPNNGIRTWPVIGWIVNATQPVWIDRKNRTQSKVALEEFQHTLEIGVPLIVYPEGTSTDGLHGLLPFKSTPFEAVASGLPIQPVITKYTTAPGEMNPAWHDDTTFPDHVKALLEIPEIRVDVTLLPVIHPEPGITRKDLAEQVRGKMLEVYHQVYEI